MSLPVCRPFVQIVEQPAPDRARFRYESEGYSTLIGISSKGDVRTHPTIQVIGYQGKALLIVSCVTKDKPYRPHPFKIDGKEGCKKGVCTIHIPPSTMTVKLSNLGIKCVKKKGIADSLMQRKELRIDPFRTGYDMNPASYDFTSVRLCFQVLIEGENGKYTVPLAPVVSDPIYDRKNIITDLVINKISHCVCRVDEEPEIIMLCRKASKENTQIRFYEEQNDILIWEDYGSFTAAQVHKKVAICFRAPKYFNLQIESPVRVLLQLRRPSDGASSMSIPFEYVPSNKIGRKRKIPKFDSLLDLADYFESCGYDPFNIKSEEVPTHRHPIVPPQYFPVNVVTNAYTFNIPPPNSSHVPQKPTNMPYAYTVQTGPSQYQAQQHAIPNSLCMDLPDSDGLNAGYRPIEEPMNDDFDVSQFTFAINTSLSLNNSAEEANQNNTDSFTRLANNVIDSIYHTTNNFY